VNANWWGEVVKRENDEIAQDEDTQTSKRFQSVTDQGKQMMVEVW
jgi:hypothetical protein